MRDVYDAVIVGGGFYGAAIATFLARRDWTVAVVEQEGELMKRASYVNQARLHNGYHYPRSFRTAARSHANLAVFREAFPDAVFEKFTKLYAIARFGSKISPRHFERFCHAVDIPLRAARRHAVELFERRLIERVYEVEEPAFDAAALRRQLTAELAALGVDVFLSTRAVGVRAPRARQRSGEVLTRCDGGAEFCSRYVLNATYAELGTLDVRAGGAPAPGGDGRSAGAEFRLVHQIAEVALVRPPPALEGAGVTVLDGPFFSVMPFPPSGRHSLTHVTYTHHLRWVEPGAGDTAPPSEVLARYCGADAAARSRAVYMLRDARRYLPALADAAPAGTMFEIKSFPTDTDFDDARPILVHRDTRQPRLISILGGKVDNIFDAFEYLCRMLEIPEVVGGGAGPTGRRDRAAGLG